MPILTSSKFISENVKYCVIFECQKTKDENKKSLDIEIGKDRYFCVEKS